MKYNLTDVASVIRSKNSGPYELTFDIIFKEMDMYQQVKSAKVFTAQMFALLYHIPESQIISLVHFDPAKAVKITVVRPIPSGALGETDVYGAQQHAPLMKMTFEL
ncbi:PF14330 domain protein [Petrimonas sp. IBARAKI]|nr:PF14330 domain protein [Petrimonas sp. IBARAKI]